MNVLVTHHYLRDSTQIAAKVATAYVLVLNSRVSFTWNVGKWNAVLFVALITEQPYLLHDTAVVIRRAFSSPASIWINILCIFKRVVWQFLWVGVALILLLNFLSESLWQFRRRLDSSPFAPYWRTHIWLQMTSDTIRSVGRLVRLVITVIWGFLLCIHNEVRYVFLVLNIVLR